MQSHVPSRPNTLEELASARVPINVLVVDDSVISRSLICRWLENLDDIKVVGTAADGRAAIQMVGRTPVDIVLLDIEMPILDGLSALPEILSARPGIKVIMASSLTRRNAQITLRALELGAIDYLTKPSGNRSILEGADFRSEMLKKIRAFGGATKKYTAAPQHGRKTTAPKLPDHNLKSLAPGIQLQSTVTPPVTAPQIIAIGCSTGGPNALNEFCRLLEKPLPVPVVIVQHMPPIFTDILAQQLQRSYNLPCTEARSGDVLQPGHIYLAPGDHHMRIRADGHNRVISVSQDEPINFCRPAVDPLFDSIAEVYGDKALGIVLTGMGRDGLRGATALHACGGKIIVQDEASSVVWGMPGAIAKAGIADEIGGITALVLSVKSRLGIAR
jgi:two-component system, chemotaxis family, protein-glutamate methylesterase/glutaminase